MSNKAFRKDAEVKLSSPENLKTYIKVTSPGLWAVVIAAVILTLLPELLRGLNDYRMLIYSIVLIVMMIVNSSPKFKDIKEKYSIKRYIATKKQPKKEEA